MKRLFALLCFSSALLAQAPSYPRPLRELNTSYFPMRTEGVMTKQAWPARSAAIRQRILFSCGLLPLPQKTPLNARSHGKIEREDYTIDRIIFESFPGHFVCGNLYLPKAPAKEGKLPVVLCPHGHWPNGRLMDLGAGSAETNDQLALGAERFESGARSPLQARCVQLARMGCAVFFYDMLGYADSMQIADHRSGKRPALCGTEAGSYGLYSPMADLRLQSNFGLQTWNSIRALDYMLSLPGADPTRVGCTGASGGATQTMILAAIDDRVTAAFPCVMVSTAMQGGCTCENSCYLRIGQGNVDIAAAIAPRPLGLTAADDWTKELQTKGYPDLLALYQMLGVEKQLSASFNIHFKHNYNHVSRVAMYGFMSQHLGLGYKAPVLERDFTFTPPAELSVWNEEHPKPTGEQTGDAHELALLKHWAGDSDAALKQNPSLIADAWKMILDRELPPAGSTSSEVSKAQREDDYLRATSMVHLAGEAEDVRIHFLAPKGKAWKGDALLWLSPTALAETGADAAQPSAAALSLLQAGVALVMPELYLPGAEQNPKYPVKERDPKNPNPNGWQHSACYTYGYNVPLLAQRARDLLTTLSHVQHHPDYAVKRIYLLATGGYAPVAAAALPQCREQLAGAVIDTAGFRFSSLTEQMHPMFVPGAVKYGDLPGLLSQAAPCPLQVFGESLPLPGVAAAYAAAKASFTSSEESGAVALTQAVLEWARR